MMSTHLRAESPICTIFYRCSGGSYSTYDDDGDSDGDHTYTLRCRIPILPIGSAIVHENTRSTMISHTHTITNYVYEQARQHTILHRQTRARIYAHALALALALAQAHVHQQRRRRRRRRFFFFITVLYCKYYVRLRWWTRFN